MKYRILICDAYGGVAWLDVFEPFERGDIICYGPDETEPDGLCRWMVARCDEIE